jgi:hypothetical protein
VSQKEFKCYDLTLFPVRKELLPLRNSLTIFHIIYCTSLVQIHRIGRIQRAPEDLTAAKRARMNEAQRISLEKKLLTQVNIEETG